MELRPELDYLTRTKKPSMSLYRQLYKNSIRWNGVDPLNDKTIIIYCEQGLGTTIQFARYFKYLKQHNVRIIVQCDSELHRLLPYCDEFIDFDTEILPEHDYHVLSLSLPFVLGIRDTDSPYLNIAETTEIDLDPTCKSILFPRVLKIGIAWEGDPEYCNNLDRSCPLKYFLPLNQTGVQLFKIQKEIHLPELLEGAEDFPLWGHEFKDMLDTAQFINAMDVIITVDTAVLHLAGAMGKKTFGLLSLIKDLRWEIYNWYPSVEMVGQSSQDNWAEVINEVIVRLGLRPDPNYKPIHIPTQERPKSQYLTTLLDKVTRLDLPHGCFNAGIAPYSNNKYICVYRPDEYSFALAVLGNNFNIDLALNLKVENCADPRLVWIGNKLLMVYSSIDEENGLECIRGAIVIDGAKFITAPEIFRISPKNGQREKNWMPFVHDGHVYLIASVKPHIIYELNLNTLVAEKQYETQWSDPWFCQESFRGNTNAIQLKDGNFLGTFHTVIKIGRMHYYDNGCYVFEGKPPFKVLRCANRTYLPAGSAVEPHFRKKDLILVNFPVGMIREDDKLLISYGDNDSAVKIMETTVQEMLDTTLVLY
jgi:predicted GH43/DUF377 family glycosyl hydrolase